MDANQAIANSTIRFRIRMGLSRPQEVSAPHKERLLLSLYDVVLSLQWVRRDIIFWGLNHYDCYEGQIGSRLFANPAF